MSRVFISKQCGARVASVARGSMFESTERISDSCISCRSEKRTWTFCKTKKNLLHEEFIFFCGITWFFSCGITSARLVLHPFFVSVSLFRGYSVFRLLYLKLTTLENILKVVKIFAQACIEMTCIETTGVRPFSSSRRHCMSSLTTFVSWQEPLNLHS